jgi:alanine dehydrogenase
VASPRSHAHADERLEAEAESRGIDASLEGRDHPAIDEGSDAREARGRCDSGLLSELIVRRACVSLQLPEDEHIDVIQPAGLAITNIVRRHWRALLIDRMRFGRSAVRLPDVLTLRRFVEPVGTIAEVVRMTRRDEETPMLVGVPTEIKNNENRVAVTPAGVQEFVRRGHDVLVQSGAGIGSSLSDEDFAAAGATIVPTASDVWGDADLLLKVKEPVEAEYSSMRAEQVLFTYLHLAASRACTDAIVASRTTAIAYETVQLSDRSLPLLSPMSEVAGRLSALVGAYHLMSSAGGRGALLGGVPGTRKASVVVIGGGVAGEHAAANALGMGADVTIVDLSIPRLRDLERRFQGAVKTAVSSHYEIARLVRDADLVVGSVLIPGAQAPKLVTDEMVASMKPGSVLVDIAIDQGGCFEGSKPTTHDAPIYRVHDAIYYCVANMPGAVPETSTRALTNATLPYALSLADKGWRRALAEDEALRRGLNAHDGAVTNAGVAEALGLDYVAAEKVLTQAAPASALT